MSKPLSATSGIYASLTYDDATSAIEWLCRAFGFEKRLVVPGPNGSVKHSELSLGGDVIMVSSAKPEHQRAGPRSLGGTNQGLCVRVSDPDAHHARAKKAGAVIVEPLHDADYGSRGYMCRDLEGHWWYFGTYSPGAHWS